MAITISPLSAGIGAEIEGVDLGRPIADADLAAIEQAWRELDRIAHAPVPEFARVPWASLRDGLIVHALQDDVTRGVRPALLAVLGAVILVLGIACANVTNLLLARGAQRRGEFAMRAALGAGRMRLIRQLLTESLLLAVVGGGLGMLVAELGVWTLVALSPPELPRVNAITVNGAAFGFALGVSTLTGVLVGLVPALHGSRGDLRTGLQDGSRRTAGGHQLTRRVLVIAEVALALVLLVSTGLLLRSVQRLFAISPGFDPTHLLTMQVQTSGHRFADDSARYRFFVEALDAVRNVHGVTAAAYTSQLPLSGDLDVYGLHLEAAPSDDPQGDFGALRYLVSPGYLKTMGIPVRHGRVLDRGDDVGTPAPVLINESFAKRAFHGQEPIGQRFRFGPNDRVWDVVVGVVGDVKQTSLAASPQDAVYLLTKQWPWVDQRLSLVVRTGGDPAALVPAIKRAIWSVDKDQPIVRVTTMDSLLARSEAERRFALMVFEAFALTALALAAIGLYGVLSSGVAERVREIGVRSALGASPRDILTLVVRQGMALTGVGMVIGLIAAVAASRGLVTLLFGVSRLDPITYSGVVALLTAVAMLACWLPASRAARVDPSMALRAE